MATCRRGLPAHRRPRRAPLPEAGSTRQRRAAAPRAGQPRRCRRALRAHPHDHASHRRQPTGLRPARRRGAYGRGGAQHRSAGHTDHSDNHADDRELTRTRACGASDPELHPTMDHSSYLRVLLSVWVGLGLGQLVQALHRLARYKGPVRWDWLPVVWAMFAFLMFVQTWWAYFTLLQSPIWVNLFVFLLPLAVFVILYLICSSALPDVSRSPEGSVVDLRTFYLGQHRYFFGLWALLLVLAVLVSVLVRGRVSL